jgi:carboxyl-terminal processing protease
VHYLVSKESFVESYVRIVDDTVSIDFSSNFGERPIDTRTVGDPNLPSDTALIKFTAFNGDAYEEFLTAMPYLKNSGKTKLILDLRNNGGGYMKKFTAIASLFINNGGKRSNVVAIVKYNNNRNEEYKTSTNAYVPLDKIVVLANENTASASECLIGALLHYGALSMDNIVVTNADYDGTGVNATYGKGIMQTTYASNWGTALRVTTARIFWPDGKTCIHGVGVKATAQNSTTYANGLTRALALVG